MRLTVFLVIAGLGLVGAEDNPNAASWQYSITVNQLLTQATLPDGDIIELREMPDACVPADEIAFEVDLIAPVIKWKAIYMHDVDITDNTMVMLECESNQLPHVSHVKVADVIDHYIVLWKDRTMGKRGEYWISDANSMLQGGKHYRFLWKKD